MTLMIASSQQRGVEDERLSQLFRRQISLAQVVNSSGQPNSRAVSRLRFGRVHFDQDKPYLAVAIEVESTAETKDHQGRSMRTTERARIPLDKPLAFAPRLIIAGPGGATMANRKLVNVEP